MGVNSNFFYNNLESTSNFESVGQPSNVGILKTILFLFIPRDIINKLKYKLYSEMISAFQPTTLIKVKLS